MKMISNLTPMMRQYVDIKNKYKDCILFFRLGDFYEMFFEDAQTASRELEITLTGKDCGLTERAPMCGVPFHSADNYISKLIGKGYKVAICEQIEDSISAKGLVKRDVIRVITPGTVIDPLMLDEKKNNYLMCIYGSGTCFGIAAVDVSTGELTATNISSSNYLSKLIDEIHKYSPVEIIINRSICDSMGIIDFLNSKLDIYISKFDDIYFSDQYVHEKISKMFPNSKQYNDKYKQACNAAGALLEYLEQTQKTNLSHIQNIDYYQIERYMMLDVSTRRNLELVETMRSKDRKGSLLWVLDNTITSMGSREMRRWIERPLINIEEIQLRLDSVEEVKNKFIQRSEIREKLKKVYDIERLVSKIILGNVNCRDLNSLKTSICQISGIKEILQKFERNLNLKIFSNLDELIDVHRLINDAIIEEPPVSVKEGNIIKLGYNDEIDKLRNATLHGKEWIAKLEAREKQTTGIKNLKVGFNKVFGYYIEITKSSYSMVPQHYIRKQTLANCERYIIQELKEMEETILGAESKVIELEYKIFTDIREKIALQVTRIKNTAQSIATLDVICSLAEVAHRESFCKPSINTNIMIHIKDGRHPVVEKGVGKNNFVPNDTLLDNSENRFNIITGPNMAGKSTYMRQVALIVLMAQIGSFVPASLAKIGVADRIFTRVGASDDLASGQSTFMIEMSEVANILKNATDRSLLLLDEIGRGTSTFDGLSIAWSVVEFVSGIIGSRSLFATHYHELTELEGKIIGVKNYCISVEEMGDDVIFLRKIIRGGADDSYGIQVAKLAGVPDTVISRAKEILKELEETDLTQRESKLNTEMKLESNSTLNEQITNDCIGADDFQTRSLIVELLDMDISKITPMEALNILYQLQEKIKNMAG